LLFLLLSIQVQMLLLPPILLLLVSVTPPRLLTFLGDVREHVLLSLNTFNVLLFQ
jgi:hypothetical protein